MQLLWPMDCRTHVGHSTVARMFVNARSKARTCSFWNAVSANEPAAVTLPDSLARIASHPNLHQTTDELTVAGDSQDHITPNKKESSDLGGNRGC